MTANQICFKVTLPVRRSAELSARQYSILCTLSFHQLHIIRTKPARRKCDSAKFGIIRSALSNVKLRKQNEDESERM